MVESIDKLKVYLNGTWVGTLALTDQHLAAFEYADTFIVNGFSIAPRYLPLEKRLFISDPDPFAGNFGVFNDSLPDGWGNLLLDRYLASKGVDHHSLDILQRLSLVGDSGMGALEYVPDRSLGSLPTTMDLEMIASEVKRILGDSKYAGELEKLIQGGGGSGGARPKVFVEYDSASWMVKFPASQDADDIGKLEYEYARVAKKCGVQMAETRLFEGKYFGVKRFDRHSVSIGSSSGESKIHMLTASGLLHASHRLPALDYTSLINATRWLTQDVEEAYRVLRLMIFNVLTGNMDDHAKNFSFLHQKGVWMFAPAYDLVRSGGLNGNHSTTIAGQGKPGREDIFKVVEDTGLDKKRSQLIFEEVYENSRSLHTVDW